MRAEIISIGDEMTSGQRVDTNSAWLSQRLGELGVTVVAHATVADDLAANVEIFRQAVERADVVISTGGLGPTADDLTREALAQLTSSPLVLDEEQLGHIRALFARRKRPMPERNVVQAMFPTGSRPIFNPNGTAPGVFVSVNRDSGGTAHVFALPGVPAEMFEMYEASVRPALVELGAGKTVIVHRRIKCFGLGESDVEQKLPDIIRRGRVPQVGITVSEATITLRITAEGTSREECETSMQPTIDTIYECLGTLVFGEEDDELPDVVLRILRDRGQTLATCEWTTQGTLATWLAEAANDATFAGGEVRTGNSPEIEMGAAECRLRYGADFALAVGSVPTDANATEVPMALATAEGVISRAASLAGHPSILKPRTAKQALNLLRLHLLRHAPPG